MLFVLIFPILIAGFFACHIHPIHSYKLHRYEGQYLYLKSAELGVKCFAIGFIIAALLHYFLPNSLNLFSVTIQLSAKDKLTQLMMVMGAKEQAEAARYSWFLILSLLTFFSAFILKMWGHFSLYKRFKTWESKIYVIGELLGDSPLDDLLFKLSLQRDKYVMLTMDDRKVYVGKVISLGEPTETDGMDQEISIMPLMSGYRNKDDLKVEFTTSYDEVDVDIYICLRQEAIVSATEFDMAAYRTWNPPTESNENSSQSKI